MLRDAVRGVVVVAAELAEETGKRVLGAAEGLLARAGVDVEAVERRIAEQFPPTPQSLQTLAGEAVTAGRAGVDLAVGVARSEVERLLEKVGERVGDQVTKVGVVLSFLESKLREVEEEQPAAARTESRAQGLFDAGWETEHAAKPSEEKAGRPSARKAAEAEAEAPPRTRAARGSAASDGVAARKAPAAAAPAHEAPAKAAPAKKAAAKKAAAKKAVAKKTVARKTSASGAAAKPAAAAKKTVVRKSAQGRPGKQEESDG